MSVEWPPRWRSLAWSNPVARWWRLLTLVSGANIAAWFFLYGELRAHRTSLAIWSLMSNERHNQRTGSLAGHVGVSLHVGLMLLLSAGYVFGCAFRSFLPRADVQRICLFDTWLSSITVGRSVATVAEVCFA